MHRLTVMLIVIGLVLALLATSGPVEAAPPYKTNSSFNYAGYVGFGDTIHFSQEGRIVHSITHGTLDTEHGLGPPSTSVVFRSAFAFLDLDCDLRITPGGRFTLDCR